MGRISHTNLKNRMVISRIATLMSERPVLVTFVDSDVFAAKVCSLLP